MKWRSLFVLMFLFSLVGLPAWAQSEAIESLPAPCEGTLSPLAEEGQPAPELGLFAPKPESRGCFMDCVLEWNATMCTGYTGAELQQCQRDGAEGCRLNCGW
jgi:hypothetical protein